MWKFFKKSKKPAVLYAVVTFIALITITQLLVWQRHRAIRDKEYNELLMELDHTKDQLNIVLNHNLSSAKTIVALVKYDRSLAWFDSVAKELMELNTSVDIVEYVSKDFIISRVYPLKGNEVMVGFDLMGDPVRAAETKLALADSRIKFAGPYDLLTGGKGIASRLPIRDNGELLGGAVTITKLSTILKRMPELENKSGVFVYQLTKINSLTNKKESFFPGYYAQEDWQVSRYNRRGNWTLHVAYAKGYISHGTIYLLSAFGFLFSLLGAIIVYYKRHETTKLEETVKKKTQDLNERMKELSTIYQVNEVLKEERQSIDIALSRIVNIIPQGWRYPEACSAKIVIGEKVYATENCTEKDTYKMQTPLKFQDDQTGYIEVSYIDDKPPVAEGPFRSEERNLLNAIAESIEIYYNKKWHRDRVARSEASLRSLVEAMPIGVLLAGVDGIILSINSKMRTIYQSMSVKPLVVGDHFIEAVREDRKEEVTATFNRVIDDMEPVDYEVKYGTEEDPLYLAISMIPVVSNARAIGVCVTVLDVTDRKITEIEHRRVITDLMQHMNTLVEFARTLTGKVREPLSVILSTGEQAKGEKDEEERVAALTSIHRSAKHIDGMLQELDETLNDKKV